MPTTITHRQYPYTGMEKLLIIGINLGTTLSGASYALLEPGKVPRIQPVTRFSDKREENGKSKIRSVVCYDQDGNVTAADPKADPEISPMLSEIEDVRRAECFEFRPRPTGLAAPPPEPAEDEAENDVPHGNERVWEGKVEGSKGSRGERDGSKEEDHSGTPSREVLERQHMNIPRPVTGDFRTPARDFTDFLQYLFKSAKEYITETERNLDQTFTWSSIERNTYFVLTHPNGWERRQQSQMRDAAVAAGLVNISTAAHRIAFVAEGKAGLHFCLDKNPEPRQVSCGECGDFLVVDCGGGIINISTQTKKGGFNEVVSQYCLQQGSISVTSRARDYFNERLKDSYFGSNDVVAEVTARAFDNPEGVNCMFHDPNRPYFAKFQVEGAQQLQEVAGLCRMLNAQIEQTSSIMADSLSYRESPISSKGLDDDVLNGLDDSILNVVPDPMKTQITLQSGLINACSYIINNGIPPSDSTTISQTPGDMVGQTGAGIWEAQPHTYITTSLRKSFEINRKHLAGISLKLITAVGGSLEVLPPQYNEVLEEIVEVSLKLHKVVNEDMAVASVMELVSFTIPCDAEFDPSRMEDTEEESEAGSGRVICTMEAGLQYRKRKERGSGEEWHVAVKAKVVLASTLDSVSKGRK